jgi:hypothetical protein
MCWLWRSPLLNGDDRFVLFILVWLVGFLLCQDLRLTASEKHLNRFRQMFDQMESIGTLKRLGSAFACCCGIFPPSITTHHLQIGRLSHPPSGSFRLAVRYKVHHPVIF